MGGNTQSDELKQHEEPTPPRYRPGLQDNDTGAAVHGSCDSDDQQSGGLSRGDAGGQTIQIGGENRRLGAIEASDDLSVVQECFVGAFLLLLMCMVYLFTRRVTASKTFGPVGTRIVRKKAPTFVRKLL